MSEGSPNGSASANGHADVSFDLGAVVRRFPGPRPQLASRRCSRPGCDAPAVATLTFSYAAKEVWLSELSVEDDPEAYDLCDRHAERTGAPSGWRITDGRVGEEHHDRGRPPGFRSVNTAGLDAVAEHPEAEDPDGPAAADSW